MEDVMQLDVNERVAENKLLILYLIDKLNFELTNSQIAKLVINIQEINYFYLQQYISQLIEDKFVECRIENNNRFYKITSSGKQALEFFKTMIRASTRTTIDNIIKQHIASLRTEMQVLADYIPLNDNEYSVTCSISEDSISLIDLKLYAGTKEQAKFICRNWEKNSQQIYSDIIRILSNERNQ